MPEASDIRGIIRQNLLDAGCSETMTKSCMDEFTQGKRVQLHRRLLAHRKELLNVLHCKTTTNRLSGLSYLSINKI